MGSRKQTLQTPWHIVHRLEDLIGMPFALDVAAEPKTAKAPDFYTVEDNGLEQPWRGLVWCNPPYNDIGRWIEAGEGALLTDPVVGAVYLLPARTSTAWFRRVRELEREWRALVAFVPHRIKFLDGDEVQSKPFEHSIVVILANNAAPFRHVVEAIERDGFPEPRAEEGAAA